LFVSVVFSYIDVNVILQVSSSSESRGMYVLADIFCSLFKF